MNSWNYLNLNTFGRLLTCGQVILVSGNAFISNSENHVIGEKYLLIIF